MMMICSEVSKGLTGGDTKTEGQRKERRSLWRSWWRDQWIDTKEALPAAFRLFSCVVLCCVCSSLTRFLLSQINKYISPSTCVGRPNYYLLVGRFYAYQQDKLLSSLPFLPALHPNIRWKKNECDTSSFCMRTQFYLWRWFFFSFFFFWWKWFIWLILVNKCRINF